MEEKGIACFPLPLKDRIPNFEGSEKAAELLRSLPEWRNAKIIMANPDYAQHRIRENALIDGKILIMATPRLRKGFVKIDPAKVKGKESFASTIKGSLKYGEDIGYKTPRPDMKIVGSVAVDFLGNRLGKGSGFGDREIEFAEEKSKNLIIVTTVHDWYMQVERTPVALAIG